MRPQPDPRRVATLDAAPIVNRGFLLGIHFWPPGVFFVGFGLRDPTYA
jgi:hypothetical protein